MQRPGSPELKGAPPLNGEVRDRTAFLVYRSHPEADHQFRSGCREDVLRKTNGAWKVRRRTIVLDANVPLDKNLGVFLQTSRSYLLAADPVDRT